ncbi:hypothetical protein L596_000867 [Steinernema carpocapsae]|uniref:SET domain-containing protein n=1 Tax=Steinernema carpocapsae TaxID=34508 RepID=A0A4U8UK50_STECR|nr:hypothetical protein L596_000867 [Steinernema carpocapsae]
MPTGKEPIDDPEEGRPKDWFVEFVIPQLSQANTTESIAANAGSSSARTSSGAPVKSQYPSDKYFWGLQMEVVELEDDFKERHPDYEELQELPSLRDLTIDELMNDVIVANPFLRTAEQAEEERKCCQGLRSPQNIAGEAIKKVDAKHPFVPKRLNLERSFIHRFGMFAVDPIKRGEPIIEYVGELVSEADADLREELYKKLGMNCTYMYQLGPNVIDATIKANFARFINHSCDPNCESYSFVVDRQEKVMFYALRDIHKNEELSIDYKFKEDSAAVAGCLCKAYNCRGDMRLKSSEAAAKK